MTTLAPRRNSLRRELHHPHQMRFGTELTPAGTRFRLWAPQCAAVSLRLDQEPDRPMEAQPGGWFELDVAGARPGMLYSFVLPDGTFAPDPASRFQPGGVHGPSEIIDPRAFGWTDRDWHGRPWEEAVIYELHIGTFTPEGTYRAVIDRLDHLVSLGVTAIELMPVAAFDGRWNWGYDGVLLYSPDDTFGRPEDLKALVDAAHARSLMVFLDVVYNHFGPSGNYLNDYTPLLTQKHDTPWGAAVNFDDSGSTVVRDFVVANARYWLDEYHFDGLRLDAVHEIADDSPRHILLELVERIRGGAHGRHVHLILENLASEARWLTPQGEAARPQLYTAQWNDDVHHALHSAISGESHRYYADYAGRIDLLARALAEGFGYQGEHMVHENMDRGEPSAHLPATAFVSFLQNHDQVGNRPFGERLHRLAPVQAVRAALAVNLLSPHIPMLFMGEEWMASQPFLFFSDLRELAESIRASRAEEAASVPDADGRQLPDPMAEDTFRACKLEWGERYQPAAARMMALYRKLLEIRRTEIVPRLSRMPGHAGTWALLGDNAFTVSWTLGDGSALTLHANLSGLPATGIAASGRQLWSQGHRGGETIDPWGVVFTIEEAPRHE